MFKIGKLLFKISVFLTSKTAKASETAILSHFKNISKNQNVQKLIDKKYVP